MNIDKRDNLIEVQNLKKYFTKTSGLWGKNVQYIKALDDVSFYIKKGETLGLVGESGCGKSTTGRTLIKLYEPTDGKILFDGEDITKYSEKQMLPYRKRMQMVFQDPYASLNSRMTINDIIGEAIETHHIATGKEKNDRIHYLLERVGLMRDHASRYPHEFSGGQRQRVGIARALAVEPEFIICDEPISALDVSIQAQVINMLEDLQNDMGLTYLFIAHDLSMVKHISNRIGVMYLGNLVEIGGSEEINKHPAHPYTKALLSAVPLPDPDLARGKKRIVLEGDVPSPLNPPSGCRFRTRCSECMKICSEVTPTLQEVAPGHQVACHLYSK
ncbi:ABC transporter ATP-binding protein [Cellulosilyticum lentocellum]|uniref:Oligopeptide/dipeptide ABC transporter, ATPase subunit n=1 Tax=Cellulosilyticum lentocellum (strain ATCC 49066 / DSM 5427 / NCIMB 11756 / RHM5) TaxID=642492 RepID=F2JJ17_CELLD|nr:oligopeptide/dipeptide ABC transporter ATP-binding protein [Cellulosilyticum lentocellum]ADZ83176.1 oligopeptide/dipeptide ABC transporter, ATPase subunit [Cellulosilyticum lentocellum DSM 5427]